MVCTCLIPFFPRTWERFTSLCRSADTCVMEFPLEQVRILIIYICVKAFLAFFRNDIRFCSEQSISTLKQKICSIRFELSKLSFIEGHLCELFHFVNDLLKETCTYSAIIEAVQVFNRGQTDFPAHL